MREALAEGLEPFRIAALQLARSRSEAVEEGLDIGLERGVFLVGGPDTV